MPRVWHYALASPMGAGLCWVMLMWTSLPAVVAWICGLVVVWASTWPDYAHPRFKGRLHPAAALVRGTVHVGYIARTRADTDLDDLQHGPSHCVEWCVLAGLAVALVTSQIPPIAPWAWWWGAAVALGALSDVLVYLPTPTGTPVSALYNALVHREVWRRHSLGWFSTDSGGEEFLAVPALFSLTGVMVLAMVGALGPLVSFLTGWS